jgi:protein-arginine kinase activator protein McsA
MTCERCAKNETVVRVSRVHEGAVTVRPLCRTCAEAEGIPVRPLHALSAWEVVATIEHPDRIS